MEGQQLNLESLRSSVGHRLTLADASGADRSVEGLVQVMQDVLPNHRTRHSYSWGQPFTKWAVGYAEGVCALVGAAVFHADAAVNPPRENRKLPEKNGDSRLERRTTWLRNTGFINAKSWASV
jgi:hypothetical protein